MQFIVGVSSWTKRINAEMRRVASHDATVLISGPTGTGKELIARGIHHSSRRRDKPFVPVDCTALTSTLFASQLFGHKKGAFTGAEYEALGCFRAAEGGTIFLDELGELSPELQAKLLRVIQERIVVPVGSHQGHPVNVRIVAATNRDLKQEVLAGRFRDDLYFRLAVVTLQAAPLADRPDDIDVLADHFLDELARDSGLPRKTLDALARQTLQIFDWPGNVRQLRHILEQAVIACDGAEISAALLQPILRQASFSTGPPLGLDYPSHDRSNALEAPWQAIANSDVAGRAAIDPLLRRFTTTPPTWRSSATAPESAQASSSTARWRTLSDLEREHILLTLAYTYNNQSAAARLLGVTRQSLIRKIKKHAIDPAAERPRRS